MRNFAEITNIEANIQKVYTDIEDACKSSRRHVSEVQLVAVSKNHPSEVIQQAVEAGLNCFGENRVQEAKAKQPLLSNKLSWHLIGHLQRNKVRQALPLFDLIHSVDSLELARAIDRIAAEEGHTPQILLQVNVSGESSKYGFEPETLTASMEELLTLERLDLRGLMTIAPWVKDPADARPCFVRLRELRDSMESNLAVGLPELSMGMTGDYQIAIEEGATIVRIGTAIFGQRNYSNSPADKPPSAKD